MLPKGTPSSQENFLVLYQRQVQNNHEQPNLLAELMKMNLQAQLFKLLSQDAASQASLGTSHAQDLSLSSHMGQLASANMQFPTMLNPQLSSLLLYSRLLESNQNGMDAGLKDRSKQQTRIVQSERIVINHSPNNSESIKTPALKEDNSKFLSPDAYGESAESVLSSKSKKISKKVNVCGHPERPHYAKNLCNQCYHKFGRTKKPWKCNHEKLYAHGLCQNCYINAYNKKRNEKNKEQKDGPSSINASNESETDVPASTFSSEEPLIVEDKAAFGDFRDQDKTTENVSN